MATEYTIDFTDENSLRSFELREFTTNGPRSPHDSILHPKATAAATTLLLYGKGAPDYGERIQENLVHMLEHFAGDEEPVFPISGQIWFDRSNTESTVDHLRVFDAYKFQIYEDPNNPGDLQWIAIRPTTADEETHLVNLYTANPSIRIRQITDGEIRNYSLNTIVVRPGGGSGYYSHVALELSQTPTTNYANGNWFIGGWEFIVQNNAPLRENLNAGGFALTNVQDPTDPQDATTKTWVETTIAAAVATVDQLGENIDVANDVTSSAVSGNVLRFDGVEWISSDIADLYLSLAGGTMTGNINMGGSNRIQNMQDPALPQDAATMNYVDTAIINYDNNLSIDLDRLTDVTISTVATNDVLQYIGGIWRNINFTNFVANNNIALTTGAVFTGNIFVPTVLATDAGTKAATKQYVDDQVAALIADVDIHIIDAQYAGGFLTLIANDPSVGSGGVITVDISAASETTSDLVVHTAVNPNDEVTFGEEHIPGVGSHANHYTEQEFPDIPLDKWIIEASKVLGVFNAPKYRAVYVCNGAGNTFYLGDTTVGGPYPTIAHTTTDIGFEYVNGFNDLNVYLDGVKQVASERKWLELGFTNPSTTDNEHKIYEGVETHLSSGLIYAFTIVVDGGAPQNIILRDTTTGVPPFNDVAFNRFELWGDIIDQINIQADFNSWGFGAILQDGLVTFYSNTVGTTSNLALTDGDGGVNLPFFVNVGVAGTVPDQYSCDMVGGSPNVPVTQTNFFPLANYNLLESGRVGRKSDVFSLAATPGVGQIVEVIIDRQPYGDIL